MHCKSPDAARAIAGFCEERARDDAGAMQSVSCVVASVIWRTQQEQRFGLYDVSANIQLDSNLPFM